ncbi:MAG: molybdopterin molybdotransferase MoeA [Gemmatimonadaceae bacterium]
MLTVVEATARILDDVRRLSVERVPLLDSLGRVLASPVISPLTLPAWDNSAMDGYAVRSEDLRAIVPGAPRMLRVLETVAAGAFPTHAVGTGEATRIMTGAPIPEGADTVVRVEDTDGGTDRVAIGDARDARKNVRRAGEDIRLGDVVLSPGDAIGPAQIGVLASVGASAVDVYRRPRVAILGSGDELVDLDRFHEALAGTKIVSSNSYTLHALVRTAGADPVSLGIAADTPADLRARLLGAEGCDLIITSAGISVGAFDYVREVLVDLGATMAFWKVRMRPGAPIGFGMLRGMPWIGLPGNPVSTMVTFELFVRPAIRKMLGHRRLFPRPVTARLEETITISGRLTHFLRAIVGPAADGSLTVRLTGAQGSGILTSMTRANALLIVPEDSPRVEAGTLMHVLPLGQDAQLSEHFAL